MTPANDGFGMAAPVSEKNTRGAVREGVNSGVHGEDQSTRDYREPAPKPSNEGNRLPGVPPIQRGN